MTRGFTLLAGVVVVAGLAIGAGLAMWQSGSKASASQPGQAGQVPEEMRAQILARMGGAEAPVNAAGSQEPDRGLPVSGVVESAAENSIALRTPNGSIKVALADSTAIRKTVSVTASELAPGEAVSVIGLKSADGVVAARSVQVGATTQAEGGSRPGGALIRQGGSPPGEQAQGNLANLSQVAGTVETAAKDKLVVKTATGSVTVAVSEQTTFRKTVDAARSDLAPGVNVVAVGQQGAEGVVTASSIQIMPEGEQGGQRRLGR